MIAAVPVMHDDLARYMRGAKSVPVVWVRVRDNENQMALIAEALRDPTIKSADPLQPFPKRLSTADDLRAALSRRALAAMVATYRAWSASLGPAWLADMTEAWVADLVRQSTEPGAERAITRVRHAHSVALQAAYGRPSLALTELEVLRWAVLAGVLPVPASPEQGDYRPEGRVVGRITAYAMQARGATNGH